MKRLLAGLIIAASGVSLAQAQPVQNCMARETIEERLNKKYNEHVVGRGITQQGAIVEVFYSHSTQTWTLVLSGPSVSCVIEAGEYWEILPPTTGETES